jgi:hypothetical protein
VKDGLVLAGVFGLGGGVKALLIAVLMGCATSLWAGNTLTLQEVEINRSSHAHGVSPLPPVPPTFSFIHGTVVIPAKQPTKPAKPVKHVSAPVISQPTQPPTGSVGDAGSVFNGDGADISGGMGGVTIFSGADAMVLLPPSINEGVFLSASGTLVNFYGSMVVGAVSGVPQP